ncbi:helix-turn-helix domain-containing protein [Acetobacter sacchari]|uniref:Helix-turn-helix domain-containing protein n=1 Tax=Acetobacter sacchari TaxID=2661687 RepID=A0ABS3LRJ1_9PROT|nr:helix-turn-helix domain-containing protein [Acetobacter sacchari]MBO1358542.1 helix-turn-helix domain-containing protein [Acetobacter sacchari]
MSARIKLHTSLLGMALDGGVAAVAPGICGGIVTNRVRAGASGQYGIELVSGEFHMVERGAEGGGTANAVRKAARLLAALSDAGPQGMELKDIGQACGLPKSTTHRLLGALCDEGLAARVPRTRRYSHVWRAPRHETIGAFHPAERLAQSRWWRSAVASLPVREHDAFFLLVHADDRALCVDACFGRRVIPSLTRGIGGHVPLGVGSGATILLSLCEDQAVEAIVSRNFNAPARGAVRREVETARRDGYVMDMGTWIAGVGGVAVSVPTGTPGFGLALGAAFYTNEHSIGSVEALGVRMREVASSVVF